MTFIENRKPYTLINALRGDSAVTRSGIKVLSATHIPKLDNCKNLFVVLEGQETRIHRYTHKGTYNPEQGVHELDLIVAPKVKYVNVYRNRKTRKLEVGAEYHTKQEAVDSAAVTSAGYETVMAGLEVPA